MDFFDLVTKSVPARVVPMKNPTNITEAGVPILQIRSAMREEQTRMRGICHKSDFVEKRLLLLFLLRIFSFFVAIVFAAVGNNNNLFCMVDRGWS